MTYLITCAFIALDFITGLVQALATKTFASSVMREGLFHKVGIVLIIFLGVLIDYAQGYMDMGVTVPVAGAVCGYICVMETGSSIENICKIDPDLMPDKLVALFGNLKGGGDDA
ncbi:MAG: phage holin family protein [Clostridiales bacterium]|nr:phage holin family protein [Clostridiales bacterium]